jgi:Na+-transporting NADH:ubiquinone oxidoreductase subunit C
MKSYSNTYVFSFAGIMVVIVAAALSFTALKLQPIQEKNRATEFRQNILSSVNITSTKANAQEIYDKYIVESLVVNSKGEKIEGENAELITRNLKNELAKSPEQRKLPIFVASNDEGKFLVIPVRGRGLWGPIWGYISLQDDYNTIYGAVFDHKGETPGLGAEINQDWFQNEFKGKQIFDNQGEFVSIDVVKGSADPTSPHQVDGISGGTITSVGLEEMLLNGLASYQAYFNKVKGE